MPRWVWLGRDGCWFCRDTNNCNQCKANRMTAKKSKQKKYKGKHMKMEKEW
jgi:hypothetical protein